MNHMGKGYSMVCFASQTSWNQIQNIYAVYGFKQLDHHRLQLPHGSRVLSYKNILQIMQLTNIGSQLLQQIPAALPVKPT
jgi:hypothetical protein